MNIKNISLRTNPSITLDVLINRLKTMIYEKVDKSVILNFYLFGSYARDTANENSDIDFCLIFDENKISEMGINVVVDDICNDLIDEYGAIINVLCFKNEYYLKNKNVSVLFNDIKREGIAC